MDRRRALAVAATAAMTLSAGSVAVAANLGLLAHAQDEPIGKLDARNVAQLLAPEKSTKSPSARSASAADPVAATAPEGGATTPAGAEAVAGPAAPAPAVTGPVGPNTRAEDPEATPAVEVPDGSGPVGAVPERRRGDDAPTTAVARPASGPVTTAGHQPPTTARGPEPTEPPESTTTTTGPEVTVPPSTTTTERQEPEHEVTTTEPVDDHDD